MSYLKSRWFGLLAIGLLVQTLLAGAWSPASAEAAPPPFYQSTITKAEVDQADHSLWVLWSDNFANQNKKSYLNHYSPDGQLLNKLDVSWKHVSDQVLGFIFEPGAPRLYYVFFEVAS